MTASVSSPEDIVNIALAKIGYKERVANLYEGSDAARVSLQVYAQTRDELLRSGDYEFAERTAALALLKSAPDGGYVPGITNWSSAYPALPWLFQYAYPADCLKLRSVKPAPIFLPDMDPQPHRFALDNDATIPAKVILSNVPSAVAGYTAQVTDPVEWDADFIAVLADAIGRRIAPILTTLDAARMEEPDEMRAASVAENARG